MKRKMIWCGRCDGRGYYYQGYGIGVQACPQCEGKQQLLVLDEWRPFEQCKENVDGSLLRSEQQ